MDKNYHNKKASILIPAYNEEKNIEGTIKSVLANTYKNIEIIVIDDGSADDTSLIVEKMQKIYPEIKLIKKENGGKADALNRGIDEAVREIIIVLDGDTIFDENAIMNLMKRFDDETVKGVAGRVKTIPHKNILQIFQRIEYMMGQNVDKEAFDAMDVVTVSPGAISAWRRLDLLACGGYPEDTIVEDQDITLEFLKKGKKIVYEPTAVAYTETPHDNKNFFKQRFRWIFGSMQCLWKHKDILVSNKKVMSNFIVIIILFFFNTLIPMLFPIITLQLIVNFLIFGETSMFVIFAIVSLILNFLYIMIAFSKKCESKMIVVLFPFQLIYYKFVLSYITFASLCKIFVGGNVLWKKIERTGCANAFYSKNSFDDELVVVNV